MFCAVALTGLSNLYQDTDPDRALSLNPFNTDAGIARLAKGLTAPDGLSQLPELERTGRETVRFSAISALAHGLLGEVFFGKGDHQTAAALFDTALSLSRTEANALQRTLMTAVQTDDAVAAISKLDTLFRRWPAQFPSYAPIIPSLIRSAEGYEVTLATLRTDPPWRRQVLRYLNIDPNTVGLAYRLQLDLGRATTTSRHGEIAATLRALLGHRQYDLAYRLFLFTLNDGDRAHYGYVFNGAFGLEPSGRPFDWSLRSDPSVKISHIKGSKPDQSDARLAVEFLGKPVKRIRASQYIYLPAGHYRLTVNLDAADLKAPRGLHLNIVCLDPHGHVVQLDIPSGSYREKTLEHEFELPDSACGVLRLGFGTDLIAESFRYRYSGTLHIHDIALIKTAP